jgi:hypothetical protein
MTSPLLFLRDPLLQHWINPLYLSSEVLSEKQHLFQSALYQPKVQFLSFFREERYQEILALLPRLKFFPRKNIYGTQHFFSHIPLTSFFKNCIERRDFKNIKKLLRSSELRQWWGAHKNLKDILNPPSVAFESFCISSAFRLWVEYLVRRLLISHIETVPRFFRYQKEDFLERHDDVKDERILAYVFYFSPQWNPQDGGLLEFFCSLNREEPPYETLVPQGNALQLFEVCPERYHRVSPLCGEQFRYSATGWFYQKN